MKIKISKNFLDGYVKVLDLGGVGKTWPDLSGNKQKDYDALRSDWEKCRKAAIRKGTGSFKQALQLI